MVSVCDIGWHIQSLVDMAYPTPPQLLFLMHGRKDAKAEQSHVWVQPAQISPPRQPVLAEYIPMFPAQATVSLAQQGRTIRSRATLTFQPVASDAA